MRKPFIAGRATEFVSLRKRDSRDAVALWRMFNQPLCRQGMTIEPFTTPAELESWFASKGTGIFELVATIDDEAIGYSGLYPCEGRQDHVGSLSLFVDDAYHRQGIGSLLMTALVATSDVLVGLRRLQLLVYCDNEPAIALYRKFGFEVEGRLECFVRREDAFEPVYAMARLTTGERATPQNMVRLLNAWRIGDGKPSAHSVHLNYATQLRVSEKIN